MAESKDTTINVDELILCEACFCSHSMLYCDMPGCIGCSTKEECLCCQEQCCLKLGAAPLLCKSEDPDVCFQTGCIVYACACKKPSTCCLYRGQVCCIVEQCAFPCDKDVPCALAVHGLTCFPKCGCCLKLGDIRDSKSVGAGGAPSTVELEALPVIATKAEVVTAPADMEMSRE